ncbi:alpha-2-macroglobulin isoform X2 [Xenopus laevis]|uniref:Alpha-2-macroglobulin isoform X2 n=1 Tax=Xenopus laevis TaxID=8355 RepID=A0A8J1L976_XENLA|nr:alpha-2-macroglobulin isoform X2 [Xenopus laevis]
MWSSALALCLLFTALPGGDAALPDPQYMLLVPTVLHGGGEEKFCLLLTHLNETVTVTLTLHLQRQNHTLLEKQVTKKEEDDCVTFMTPKLEAQEVAILALHVHGDSLHFKSQRNVLIKPLQNPVFVQTDKPIYKPGQKVQFRIACLDENFYPISEKYPVVYITDPQGNRINQWLNLEGRKGITQESFELSPEPKLGTYKVTVEREKANRITHDFSVEEYVLPKYEVQVKLPPVVTVLDEAIQVTVCGKYTYGKPVLGMISVQVCRKFESHYNLCEGEKDSVCEEINHRAGPNGCFSEVVSTKIFQMRRTGYKNKIIASAKITEDGTGMELTGEGSSEIKNTLAKVSFRHIDSHYKKGLPLYGQLFLEDGSGNPMSNETVVVFVGTDGTNFTYTTGQDGTAEFLIDTSHFQQSSLQIRARYKERVYCYSNSFVSVSYEDTTQIVKHFHSRDKSYLKIQPIYKTLECQKQENIIVHFILSSEGVGDTPNAVFYYLVMAKGGIAGHGKNEVEISPNQNASGTFKFRLTAGTNIAPSAKFLVYLILNTGEVIADSISLKVEKCFANKVELSFSPSEALPGAPANLHLVAAPSSLCAVRAVDESVLILKPEAELSAQSIYDLLPLQDLSGYNHDGHFLEEPRDDPCLEMEPLFINGIYYMPSNPDWDTDTYTILKSLGLKVFTNTKIRIPIVCESRRHFYPHQYVTAAGIAAGMEAVPGFSSMPRHHMELEFIETVRKYFPETWLWKMVETDADGKADLAVTVPDTLTTWKTGMFCTSQEVGFGLSETVSLVAFQPFFLHLTLPYSAIRGEIFTLKATVSNYLSQTIRVGILLEDSNQFLAKPTKIQEDGYCIKANGQVTVSWEVTLKSLGEVNFTVSAETQTGEGLCENEIVSPIQGRKDTITKHIIVEPEGLKKEETHSTMICGIGSEITEKIPLKLPEKVVEGSARAYFSVIGDILGKALQNLGNLVQMPYGCGEQNMVRFTPIIYISEYLNKTNQLTPEMKSKTLSYMSIGYQKQLSYKHTDGSYSAFGRYEEGNTWLTAFTMKSFARARAHIYIEENLISDALLWLSNRQKPNGCFQSVGKLFNNAMKGGVDDEVTLAAYITISLLEYPLPVTHPAVRNGLFCLESALSARNSIYTKALMAYAFTLAGKMDIRHQLIRSLDEQAIKKDGTIHWHRPELSDDSEVERFPYRRAPSAEVEMTSYVLLALLSKPDVSAGELTMATQIVSWIIKQQNPSGGFSSTQDTVVALQALALYGSLTLSHDARRTVSLSLDKTPISEFHVEDSNRLLLQHIALKEVPGDYLASVIGSGCLYLQTTLRYNIPIPKEDAAFTISVTTNPDTCDQKSLKIFNIAVNVSYVGKRESSNMAVVQIKLPSGYIPIKSTVKQMTIFNRLIKRTETRVNEVIVYFELLTKYSQHFMFLVEQEIPISNLQPATATVYDYYETDDMAVTKYNAPCTVKDGENKEQH